MKNKIVGVGIFILIVIGLVLVLKPSSQPSKKIRVGAILPLTGPITQLGEEMKNGLQLAQEVDDPENLDIFYEDSQANPKMGLSAAQKLLTQDGIDVGLAFATPVVAAVQKEFETKQIPLLAGTITSKIVGDSNNVVRLFYNNNQGINMFPILFGKAGSKRIAVFYQKDNEGIVRTADGVKKKISESGLVFTGEETFLLSDSDMKTQLTKIKNANPDTLVLLGFGSKFELIFKTLKELQMNDTRIVGHLDFADVPLASDKSLYEGAVFIAPKFLADRDEKAETFYQTYQQNFGKIPGYLAAYAYDNYQLLKTCVDQVKSKEKLSECLLKDREFEGVSGKIVIKNRDAETELILATWKNGEIVKFE